MIKKCDNHNDLGERATMGVKGGGAKTPLSTIRPCGMGISHKGALEMSTSLNLTIGYLLRNKWKDLESKSHGKLVMIRV